MRVLLFSRYQNLGASSRLRSLQFISLLSKYGVYVTVSSLFSDDYVEALYAHRKRKAIIILAYLRRIWTARTIGRYDVIWIEKELFPYLPAWLERLLSFLNIPYLVDYDDAIFHRYDHHNNALVRLMLGKKIKTVMACSAVVSVGNNYLKAYALAAGAKQIAKIPTVVDLNKYFLRKLDADLTERASIPVTIGWIGSPQTSRYLNIVSEAIRNTCRESGARFVAVGASYNDVVGIGGKTLAWTEEGEVEAISSFDIGIMPLPDEPFERGKCAYKIIQYMACGIPVVASPVGVNAELVLPGENGFLASNHGDWEGALKELIESPQMRMEMGLNGRLMVEKEYNLETQITVLVEALKIALSKKNIA